MELPLLGVKWRHDAMKPAFLDTKRPVHGP
jgi:hypothetical protein